ncbi:unnamed protein product [Rotaria magnacalcarata]|uniref:Uncharacterized protein n=1 Tax=Rotaria magnacalcarata TaxID=392030 RepID=A0A816L2R9_9BILA|nr:unnamed protein product [Rotaria magnacalcarata]
MEQNNKNLTNSNLNEQNLRYKRELSRLRSIKYRNSLRDRCRPSTTSSNSQDITSQVISFNSIDHQGSSTQAKMPADKLSNVVDDDDDHFDQIEQNFSEDVPSCDGRLNDDDFFLTSDEIENSNDNDYNDIDSSSDDSSIDILDDGQNRLNKHCFDLVNFIRLSNLNKKNTNHLLKLINDLCSDKNLPRTDKQLWQQVGVEFNYQLFIYCTNCMTLLKNVNDNCDLCINKPSVINLELILFSIENELYRIVKMNEEFLKGNHLHGGGDLIYGNVYQSKRKNNPLMLIVSTDGKPTTKNSRSSMWSVLATIAEIPLPCREYKENVVLLGLWHSTKSSPVNILLGSIVDNIKKLQMSGLDIPFQGKAYLSQFASSYSKCGELYSTHALIHLYEQSLSFGSLSSHSLLSTESYLHHLHKLAHGTISLGQQMAHWHMVDRHLQTSKIKFSATLFETKKFLEKTFFNYNVKDMFEEEFTKCFLEYFGIVPVDTIKYYSRYQSGLTIYHSISYSKRKTSSSYNVSIIDDSNAKRSITGQIIFFFEFNGKNFLFFKKLKLSDLKFSSFIQTNNELEQWSNFLNSYYYFVHSSSTLFDICLCTNIYRKCLLLPFDNKFSLCTEIELETEHD